MRNMVCTRPKYRILAGTLISMALGAWLTQVCLTGPAALAGEPAGKTPFAADSAAVAEGAKLFDEKCAECHGDGTGLSGPDLTDGKWFYGGSDAEVIASIKNGRPGGMPSWNSSLNDEQTRKLLTFIMSLRK